MCVVCAPMGVLDWMHLSCVVCLCSDARERESLPAGPERHGKAALVWGICKPVFCLGRKGRLSGSFRARQLAFLVSRLPGADMVSSGSEEAMDASLSG